MDKTCVVAHISDIHFGALQGKELFFQLKEGFLNDLEKLPILDGIFIAGDLTHFDISANSSHFKFLGLFLECLISLAKRKNVKFIRLIKGTRSHDHDQLENIKPILLDKGIDVKVINEVTEEVMENGLKILYIPEEYVTDTSATYDMYLEKEQYYDFVVGHGLVPETCFNAKKQESAVTMSKAPIIDSKKLEYCCKGPVLYGHIHTACIIRDKLYYSGSYSRWCYGEEEDKGFNLVYYTPDTGNFKVEFKKNSLAHRYNTMIIDFSKRTGDMMEEIDSINNIVTGFINDHTHIRTIFVIPDDYEKPDLLSNYLTELFSNKKNVNVIVKNNSKIKATQEMDKKIELIMSKYDVIFSNNVEFEEKVRHFINTKYGKEISVEKIRDYLHNQINLSE